MAEFVHGVRVRKVELRCQEPSLCPSKEDCMRSIIYNDSKSRILFPIDSAYPIQGSLTFKKTLYFSLCGFCILGEPAMYQQTLLEEAEQEAVSSGSLPWKR